MSDDELANIIESGELAAISECAYYGTSDCYIDEKAEYNYNECAKGILKWLRSEVN